MTQILWCSNDINDWLPTPITEASSTKFDNTRVPYAIEFADDIEYHMKEDHIASSGDDTWYHMRIQMDAESSTAEDGYLATIRDASGKLIARVDVADGEYGVSVSGNGTTFGTPDFTVGQHIANTKRVMDVHVTVTGSDVTADFYLDESLEATATVTNSASLTAPTSWVFDNNDAVYSSKMYISAFLVQDTSTLGAELSMLQPTTNGDNTAWDGAVADLNDTDQSTGLTTAVAAERHSMNVDTYAGTDSIVAVVAVGSMQAGVDGPTQAQMGLRISSTNYDGTDTTLVPGRNRVEKEFLLDPSDSGAWTAAKVNACQLQVESVA